MGSFLHAHLRHIDEWDALVFTVCFFLATVTIGFIGVPIAFARGGGAMIAVVPIALRRRFLPSTLRPRDRSQPPKISIAATLLVALGAALMLFSLPLALVGAAVLSDTHDTGSLVVIGIALGMMAAAVMLVSLSRRVRYGRPS